MKKKLLFSIVLVLMNPIQTYASIMTYTDRTSFQSSLADYESIDFDGLYLRPLPRHYQIDAINFDSTGRLYSNNLNGSSAIASENGPPITLDLNTGFNAIGMDIGFLYNKSAALLQYTIIGESGILASNTSPTAPKPTVDKSGSFFGWVSEDEDILRVELYVYIPFVSAYPMIDNVNYGNTVGTSVPDASVMLLLGSSLLGLAVFSRKSKGTG